MSVKRSNLRYKPTYFDRMFEQYIVTGTKSKTTGMYHCRVCKYKNKQKSNFRTHTKIHFKFKDIWCEYPRLKRRPGRQSQEDGRCHFRTRDPGSYCRHKIAHIEAKQLPCASRMTDPDVTGDLDFNIVARLAGMEHKPVKVAKKKRYTAVLEPPVPLPSPPPPSPPPQAISISPAPSSCTPPPAYSLAPAPQSYPWNFPTEPINYSTSVGTDLSYPTIDKTFNYDSDALLPSYDFGVNSSQSLFTGSVACRPSMSMSVYDQENVNNYTMPLNQGLAWNNVEPEFSTNYGVQNTEMMPWNAPPMMPYAQFNPSYNF